METRTQDTDAPAGWFDPLAGWETASRWNRATFDWMAKGWQQWVALLTTVPPQFVTPPSLESPATTSPSRSRAGDAILPTRAMAKAETKRAPKAPAKTRKTAAKKTRTRRS